MMRDIKKYAHGLSRIWMHISFKVKYCHPIFNIKEVREACQEIMFEVARENNIEIKHLGFDDNHLHFIPDLGKHSEPELRKLFKGITGKKLLERFPFVKRKYFWDSGLWGRQYYCYAIGSDMNVLAKYVQKQKFFTAMHHPEQRTLDSYHGSLTRGY